MDTVFLVPGHAKLLADFADSSRCDTQFGECAWRRRLVQAANHPAGLCELDDRGIPDWLDGLSRRSGALVLRPVYAAGLASSDMWPRRSRLELATGS